MGYSPVPMIDASTGKQYLSIGSMMIPASSLPHPLAHMYLGSYVLSDGRLQVDPKVYKAVEEQQKYNYALGELARKQFKPSKPVKKTEAEIYDEEAFSGKPKAEMGRLSKAHREKVKELNNPFLNEEVEKGDKAEAAGDKLKEAAHHRHVIDFIRINENMVYIDDESSYAYKYNCLPIHNPLLLEKMTKEEISIYDAFYFSEKDKTYFLKDEYINKFAKKGWIERNTDEIIYSNYHKTIKPPIIYAKSYDDGQKQITKLYSSQYQPIKSASENMTAEEYDRIAFK